MVSKVQNVPNIEKSSSAAVASAVAQATSKRSLAVSAPADVVTVDGSATIAVVSDAARATGKNPFEALVASTVNVPVAELRLVAAAEATSASCEPNLATLAVLAELESRITPRDAWGPTKVRNGYMQVTYDAQEERVAASRLERDDGEKLSRVLVERPATTDAKEILHAQEWRAQVSGYYKGGDVNAFVQQVLRECYLLGQGDLAAYGERVKSLNELKKKIRDEAKRVRDIKNEWAAAAKGDESWVAPYFFEPVKLDSAQLALIPDTYTQEEIDELDGAQRGKITAKNGPVSGEDGERASNFWTGSTLAPGDAEWLSTLGGTAGDKIRNVKSTFEDIKSLVPSMSAADLQTLLLPILNNLKKHGHEGGILELVRVMSAEQRMVVAAAGFGSDSPAFWRPSSGRIGSTPIDQFSVEERAEYNSLLVAAAHTLDADVVTTSGKGLTTAQASDVVQAHKAKLAAGMETSSESALPMPEVASAGDKTVGSPKRIDTVQGLDEHLKSLEDAMNSVGDDAQLANIDLQNCLQRQQQTLQMMSNISKTLHDVAMSIIRNMNS